MTLRTAFAATLVLCATFVTPGVVGAASLSPLDTLVSGAAVPGLYDVPGMPTQPAEMSIASEPMLSGPAEFKFVDDTGLNANPLKGILPESQWANPQAVQNNLIQRR